ncbi:MAG: AMMECR1 domain-containing protein [Candidatus Aenigmatarchaeota archaeon]
MGVDFLTGDKVSIENGQCIIRFARKAVEEWVKNNKTLHETPPQQIFNENHGLMLSIHHYPSRKLHGRIGYPYPLKGVAEVLVRCAVSACQDPRSPSLKSSDLNNVIIEVSVLSQPRLLIKPYEKNFNPNKEGLVVVRGAKHALMMPGDIPKSGKDAITEIMKRAEIENTDNITKFYKFETQTFFETAPSGGIMEKTGAKPAKKDAGIAIASKLKNNKQFKHKKRD